MPRFLLNFAGKKMKFKIEDDEFVYEVDWTRKDTIDGGMVETYFPDAAEAIEAFIKLLTNVYSKEAIGKAFEGPLDAKLYMT